MSGFTPKNSLAPPHPSFAPVFDFVEDQQRSVFGANVAQALQESGLRHAQADVHQDGLENNRGDLARIFAEAPLDAARLLKLATTTLAREVFWNAAAAGHGIGASASPQSSAWASR